jgi:hypothetical protein
MYAKKWKFYKVFDFLNSDLGAVVAQQKVLMSYPRDIYYQIKFLKDFMYIIIYFMVLTLFLASKMEKYEKHMCINWSTLACNYLYVKGIF